MNPPATELLAKAVQLSDEYLQQISLADIFESCRDLDSCGCVLAWGLCNAKQISRAQGCSRFEDGIFSADAWPRARRARQALPLCEGDFTEFINLMMATPLDQIREVQWLRTWNHTAWKLVACYACNALMGAASPLPSGRWSKAERKLVGAVGSAVDRLLGHGHAAPADPWLVEKELNGRRVSYSGEEIGICHPLSLEQVLPALPPPEHGGSIELTRFLSSSSCDFLKHPLKSLVADEGQELPKLQGKIHVKEGEMELISSELVKRGVCTWIPSESVLHFRGQPVLNGLFGVAKPTTLPNGKSTLRLIMNLVPSNSVIRSYEGSVKSLPQITSWMSIVLEENQQMRIWQSDMSSAFYLFRLPASWAPLLAFNVAQDGDQLGLTPGKMYNLACTVLPMGWTNSVSLMQEASENILLRGMLSTCSQITRNNPLPIWATGLVSEAYDKGKTFWHVYLDNFAAGEVGTADSFFEGGSDLHKLAETAWANAKVVSSPKKRKVAELEAQELGAHINGTVQTIGGSPERLVKLVQATLFLLSRPHLSKKLTQIVAGRWIHVFQFRRPAMSFLESTWEFIAKKGLNLHLVNRVRRELFNCMCSVPFLHTFLGASVAGVTTASDASNSGGAVGIAKSLTAAGQDYVTTLANFPRPRRVPVLVISLFNGIGGALRAYDVLSVVPMGAVVFEIHPPANRVTMKRWPHAEICGDVRSLDEVMIRNWLDKYIPLREVHLWAGFPCNDLSSVRAGRQGLQGPGSGLFWEVVRIKRLLEKELPPHVALKYVGENVASMDKEHCEEISSELEVRPYHLNPSGAVPMQRPRLCWTSEEIEGAVEGITFEEKTHWTEITATAPYPTTGYGGL